MIGIGEDGFVAGEGVFFTGVKKKVANNIAKWGEGVGNLLVR
jgi:hypothetical protein